MNISPNSDILVWTFWAVFASLGMAGAAAGLNSRSGSWVRRTSPELAEAHRPLSDRFQWLGIALTGLVILLSACLMVGLSSVFVIALAYKLLFVGTGAAVFLVSLSNTGPMDLVIDHGSGTFTCTYFHLYSFRRLEGNISGISAAKVIGSCVFVDCGNGSVPQCVGILCGSEADRKRQCADIERALFGRHAST